MTLDQKLRSASDDARARVQHLDVPPLRTGGWQRVMTQLRTTMTKRGEEMRNRPVLVFAGAVLAVVFVVGVVAVLQARSTDEPVSGPTPTAGTVTTTTPSTTPGPQATPPNLDFQSGALEPGTYVITWVEPFEITITVPEGWRRNTVPSMVWHEDSAANLGFVAVENVYADPCAAELGMLDPPVGPTVDDLVAALAALPGIETTEPRDVTVDGFAAKYIEIIGSSEADQCGPEGAVLWTIPSSSDSMPAPGPNDHPLKVWVVDGDGERLVIVSEDRVEASPSRYAERDLIFDSIQIDVP